MAVYSTPENQKDQYLDKTLQSLADSVDFTKHRLMLSVNAYTPITQLIFKKYKDIITEVIYNDINIGTAEAINKIWQKRLPTENAIKMDDDVVINKSDVWWWSCWVDVMDELIANDKFIGQIGLKRKDLIESPSNPNPFYRSTLSEVQNKFGNILLEKCHHIMGTCVMHSANLLNEVGYMWQPDLYGFDDSYMSCRSEVAGFKNVFIPAVDIDHIDEGNTPYQKWKEDHVRDWLNNNYENKVNEYKSGKSDIYYNPFI